ncbi:MAG: peroxidase family protein [Pseudomonadota bacterium]
MSAIPLSERLLGWVFARINRRRPWYTMPTAKLQIANLVGLRGQMRQKNLYDTYRRRVTDSAPIPEEFQKVRTSDGSYNDPRDSSVGQAGTRFGRNVPLSQARPASDQDMLTPDPREISNRLLARQTFLPASSINVLAAAWLQFMVHDWFGHGKNLKHNPIKVEIDPDDGWHERPMRVPRTQFAPHEDEPTRAPRDAYRNVMTHWWDGSQIYGSSQAEQDAMRQFEDGLVRIKDDGHLELDADGIELSGLNDNWWLGLSLLHTLFHREHNAICRELKSAYPDRDDEWLFQTARLINAALLAKIHTIEWTPALLDTPALWGAMRGNWWGILGEGIHRRYGRVSKNEVLSGIMGSDLNHHAVPFAMTEEFVAVYRMHPLIPDRFSMRRRADDATITELSLKDIAARNTHGVYHQASFEDSLYSLGTEPPGAICLGNYPNELRRFTRQDDGDTVDIASIDVIRDRERGVPRYNQFRRLLGMPPMTSIETLTSDHHWRRELNEIYDGDIEKVDPMIGMYAEAPPPGFAFSDTAFRIFILMASRRLKSDRFFTSDYRPGVYTPEGMAWVTNNDFKDVIIRHCPSLASAIEGIRNPFFPWRKGRSA